MILKLALVVFAAIMLTANLVVGIKDSKMKWTETIVKAFTGICLVAFALVAKGSGWLLPVTAVGLFLSTLGDVFLTARKKVEDEKQNGDLFVYGLGSYLTGYLVFSISLMVYFGLTLASFLGATAFILCVAVQYFTLDREKIKGFEIPIIAYLFQAATLGTAAVTIIASGFVLPNILIALGCLSLFMSDSFIGHNLFRKEMKNPELFITPTYVVGLVTILLGVILL